MGRALVLAILAVAASSTIAGQTLVVLRIRAVLTDAAGQATPLARHALIISDNPPTRETRRILTGFDGTATVRLSPGNYTVESDQPLVFQGKAYHWRQTLDIVAGRDSTLDLTLANAVADTIAPGTTNAGTPLATDTSLLLRPWLDSVVQLWTPTAHASGFLVDATGLIATNQRVVGDATSVEVQLSRSIKVAGTVVEADRERDIAIVRIDPAAMAAIRPVPLACTGSTPPVTRGQELFTLAAPLHQGKGWTPATVSRVDARGIASDLTLASGGMGGPVFNASGDLVGISSLPGERDEPRRGAARVVRIDGVCELVAAAAKKATDAPAPSGMHLPVEPAEPAPIAAFKDAVKRRAGNLKPYPMAASEFDVTFITPLLNYAAQSQPNQSFSNWSDYVADIPPVLLVRVTPKMTESFWARVARGAAYTQGMALPALKRLKSGFHRMQAFCDRAEVTPIHPFKLELRVSETNAVYEGLYVFDPAALGPGCSAVTLVLYSEKQPEKADTRLVDPGILQQIRRDFDQ
ncbi:MAG TPA: trypsin-like peptidase domain-containing protein [Vicinamibacterales bacterium]|nr:trypsin-like peptidase domain-containing protein [Vicinamibacterales bacterium]